MELPILPRLPGELKAITFGDDVVVHHSIYNTFARSIAGYRALVGDASAEVLRLVSRDLDRPAAAPAPSARRPTPLSAVE